MATQTARVADVMTASPETLPATASATEAAQRMRERNIGDVVVAEQGQICGIVTDRDLVVRVLGEGRDPAATKLAEICSRELTVLAPSDSVESAMALMKDKAVRRLPVVDGGRPVGILSLGDLAQDRDPKSVLGQVSSAPANR
jgi:CBS domain-containing protein